MSFWSDASPVVKGAIVLGVLICLYAGIAYVGGFFPYGEDVPVETQRGLHSVAQ